MAWAIGTRVAARQDASYAGVSMDDEGVITFWDSWSSEEYPYHVRFDSGARAAFARHELRLVGP